MRERVTGALLAQKKTNPGIGRGNGEKSPVVQCWPGRSSATAEGTGGGERRRCDAVARRRSQSRGEEDGAAARQLEAARRAACRGGGRR